MTTTVGAPCAVCGAYTLVPRSRSITTKRRVKFGFTWLLLTLFTGGLAFLAWLVWPRRDQLVAVDRYLQCTTCGARQ